MTSRRVNRSRRFPIGNKASLADFEGDPHPLLERLRSNEPVSWLPVFDGWLITRRDLVHQVMRDSVTYTVDDPRFSTGQVVGASMLSLDGAEHIRHREPFVPHFRPGDTANSQRVPVERHAARLVNEFSKRWRAELVGELAAPLAVTVIVDFLGLVGVNNAMVTAWYDAIVAAVHAITAGDDPNPSGREAVEGIRKCVARTIVDAPRSVVGAAASAGLSVDEVTSDVAVTMFGAIETTEGMIANALLQLLEHRDELALVLRDRSLIASAVEESLRLEPAAAVIDRYTTRSVELGGVTIEQGELVRLSLAAANRDPQVFVKPDRFDFRRPNLRLHLTFAAGPHGCIGSALARREAVAAIDAVLSLPALRLDDAFPSNVRGLVFRKPPTLRVRFDPSGVPGLS